MSVAAPMWFKKFTGKIENFGCFGNFANVKILENVQLILFIEFPGFDIKMFIFQRGFS